MIVAKKSDERIFEHLQSQDVGEEEARMLPTNFYIQITWMKLEDHSIPGPWMEPLRKSEVQVPIVESFSHRDIAQKRRLILCRRSRHSVD
jgi:hypothetical protein